MYREGDDTNPELQKPIVQKPSAWQQSKLES